MDHRTTQARSTSYPSEPDVSVPPPTDSTTQWHEGSEVLDHYLIEAIKEGGMGYVYIAHNRVWNVKVAIKSPKRSVITEEDDFTRILREADLWIEMGMDPHIAYCFFVRSIDDIPHIFIEFIDGGNLRDWIDANRCRDLRIGLDVAIQFCHGMEFAHSKGVIHRDLKPENVLMTKRGELKLTDFGLVWRYGWKELSTGDAPVQDTNIYEKCLTQRGAMGTPDYMSPEQWIDAHSVGKETDIFSFGVTLYEMFCNQRPYENTLGPAQSPPEPALLRGKKGLPPQLGILMKRCVDYDPQRRYHSFKEIRYELIDIYQSLYGQMPLHAEKEEVDLEAASLNNRGVSYFEIGKREHALKCFQKALKVNNTHQEATYNLSLMKWREGEIDDSEVLRFLNNCQSSSTDDPQSLNEMFAHIYAETFDPAASIKIYSESFRLFKDSNVSQIAPSDSLLSQEMGISSVAILPESERIAYGGLDSTIKVVNLEPGQKKMLTLAGHVKSVTSVAPFSNGTHILSGSRDNSVKIWDVESGQCLKTLKGHNDWVLSAAISPNGKIALSGSKDGTIKVWNLGTGACIYTLEGHTGDVTCVTFGPESSRGYSCGGRTIKYWDLAKGKCLITLEGHEDTIRSLSVSSDGGLILSGSWDRTVRFWDIRSSTGRCVQIMKGHRSRIWSVALCMNTGYALSAGGDGEIKLWELNRGRCRRTLIGHEGNVWSVALSHDGLKALSGGEDGTVRFWKIDTRSPYEAPGVLSKPRNIEAVRQEIFDLQDKIEVIKALINASALPEAFDQLITLWKEHEYSNEESIYALYRELSEQGMRKSAAVIHEIKVLRVHIPSVRALAVSTDNSFILSAGDKDINLWSMQSDQCLKTMSGHGDEINALSLSKGGRFVLSGSSDKTVRLWDVKTGQCLRTMQQHKDWVNTVAISPGGRYALSGGSDKTIILWDIKTGESVRLMKGHTNWVYALAISFDSRYGLSGSGDKTVKLWSLNSGKCIRTLKGHSRWIRSVAFSPDSRFALSAGDDKTIRLWDIATGRCLHVMEGHTRAVESVLFSPDGSFAISGSSDKTIKLWDIEKGTCIETLKGHSAMVRTVLISPDSLYIISAGDDETLRVWKIIWNLEFS